MDGNLASLAISMSTYCVGPCPITLTTAETPHIFILSLHLLCSCLSFMVKLEEPLSLRSFSWANVTTLKPIFLKWSSPTERAGLKHHFYASIKPGINLYYISFFQPTRLYYIIGLQSFSFSELWAPREYELSWILVRFPESCTVLDKNDMLKNYLLNEWMDGWMIAILVLIKMFCTIESP